MVVRGKRECVVVGVEFDVAAEDVGDGTILDEIGNAVGAGQIGVGIIDDEASGGGKNRWRRRARSGDRNKRRGMGSGLGWDLHR